MATKDDKETHDRKTIEKLKRLKLHETASVGEWDVIRVPGGLIYHKTLYFRGDYVPEITSVFVPFPIPEPMKF